MSTEMDFPEYQQYKYNNLLKPLRELADNWNIDIANELEDYLTDLQTIRITFDGGKTIMNFAEAALLIQGSTGVFSRKVEFLYSLTFEVLNRLIEKRTAAGKNSEINNEATEETSDEGLSKKRKKKKSIEDEFDIDFVEFLPLDDIPQGTSSQIDLPLDACSIRHKKSIYSSKFDLPLGLQYENTMSKQTTNFKMTSLHMDPSGALLLQQGDKFLFSSMKKSSAGEKDKSLIVTFIEPQLQQQQGESNMDLDFGGAGDDLDFEGPVISKQGNLNNHHQPSVATPQKANWERNLTGSQNQRPSRHHNIKPHSIVANEVNGVAAWEPLDPHNANGDDLPIGKKKTTRIPRVLKEELFLYTGEIFPGIEVKSLNTLYYPKEFKKYLELEKSRRHGLRLKSKEALNRLNKHHSVEDLLIDYDDAEDDNVMLSDDRMTSDLELNRGQPVTSMKPCNNNFDAADIGGVDIPYGDEDADFDGPIDANAGPGNTKSTTGDEKHEAAGDISLVVQSYEDFCKKHLESYQQLTSTFNQELQLMKRVQEWQEQMEVKLEKQEKMGPYDVEEYGHRVLENIPEKNKPEPFQNITKGLDGIEVCRWFLATLQLANFGQLDINDNGHDEFSVIKLLE